MFVTNVSAILTSGLVVMGFYRVSQRVTVSPSGNERRLWTGRAVAVILIALVVISVPLTYTSLRVAEIRATEATVSSVTAEWASATEWEIVSVDTLHDAIEIQVAGPSPEPDPATLRTALDAAGLPDESVRVEFIPSTQVDLPPTPD